MGHCDAARVTLVWKPDPKVIFQEFAVHLTLQKVIDVLQDESGQDIIEYALVAAFIGLGAVASERTLASAVRGVFTNIATTITTAI